MSAWRLLMESWSACGVPGLGPSARAGRLPIAAVDASLAAWAAGPQARRAADGPGTPDGGDPGLGLPPHLGGQRRTPRSACAERAPGKTPDVGMHEPDYQLLRACALLWHDHLHEAHELVQDMDGADAAFIHAIMHRREPDAWNSKYWFRRVGRHPAMVELAGAAADLLAKAARPDLARRLIRGGVWDAFAFVDVCDAGRSAEGSERMLLERVQGLEVGSLADWIWR